MVKMIKLLAAVWSDLQLKANAKLKTDD